LFFLISQRTSLREALQNTQKILMEAEEKMLKYERECMELAAH